MNERHQSKRTQTLAIITLTAAVITLASILALRLSDETLAVLVGAVCGVAAAVPTSFIAIILTQRRDQRRDPPVALGQPYPPVVVVTGGQPQQMPEYSRTPAPAPLTWQPRHEREFTIVGGEYTDE
jgi:hypothetical protein